MNEHLRILKETVEERDLLTAELAAHAEPDTETNEVSVEDDPTVFQSREQGPLLRINVEGNNSFLEDVIKSYPNYPLFKHVVVKLNKISSILQRR